MSPLRVVLFCWMLLWGGTFVRAQPPRALYRYNTALDYKAAHQDERAYIQLRSAVKADASFTKAWSTWGSWLESAGRYAEAAAVYSEAAGRAPGGVRLFSLPQARALLHAGAPADAVRVLEGLRRSGPASPAADTLLQQARWAAAALRFRALPDSAARSLGPRINTPEPENFPVATPDGRLLLFTRRVGGMDDEILEALPDSCGGWFAARPLPTPPNTPASESALALSADEHYLFFCRCDRRSPNGWDGGGCDLYLAYTATAVAPGGEGWTAGEPFGATINTPGYEGTPALSADNRTLYFSSNRPGGYGGLDLWSTAFVDGLWQAPRNLGPAVNTAGDEAAPFLHPDGRTLFFASAGRRVESLGGWDLYRATRTADTAWTGTQNLGPPINTGRDEGSIHVSRDGRTAIFSSDRGKIPGDYDLYSAPLPEALRPAPTLYVRGRVTDSSDQGRSLPSARLQVADAKSGAAVGLFTAARGDASFMLVLRPGARYTVTTTYPGFSPRTDTLATTDTGAPDVPWDVALLPPDWVPPVYAVAPVAAVPGPDPAPTAVPRVEAPEAFAGALLLRLHFEKNSIDLDAETHVDILSAVQPYLGQPGARFLVQSHTDNTGTPLLNEQISALRAGLVGEALRRMGLPTGAIETRGLGEASPLAPNSTEEGRRLNRRVEIFIVPTTAAESH